jgi:uncharacterized protein (DUF58 family)
MIAQRQGKPVGRWSLRFRRAGRGRPYRHAVSITLAGLTYLVVCLMVGLAAVNHQINLLFLIFGILLGGLLASGVLSTLSLSSLRVGRRLPLATMAGRAVLLLYEVTNRKRWFSSYSLHVCEHGSPSPCGEVYLPTVARHSSIAQPALLLCDRRGIYRFQAMTIYSRFPFSLFVSLARFKVLDELVVYPTIGRLTEDALALSVRQAGAGQLAACRSGGQDEFFGLREYRPGDNPRLIHWRRAFMPQTGALLVREMSPLTPRRLIVMVSIGVPSQAEKPTGSRRGQKPAPDDRLEKMLSLAATVIQDAHRRGVEVGLLIVQGECYGDERWFPPASGRRLWLSMMRALASAAPTETGLPSIPHTWLRELGRSRCLWMTAGLDDAQIRRQLDELISWNIPVQLVRAEQTNLDRLIALPTGRASGESADSPPPRRDGPVE